MDLGYLLGRPPDRWKVHTRISIGRLRGVLELEPCMTDSQMRLDPHRSGRDLPVLFSFSQGVGSPWGPSEPEMLLHFPWIVHLCMLHPSVGGNEPALPRPLL